MKRIISLLKNGQKQSCFFKKLKFDFLKFQLRTEFETMSATERGNYDVAMDISEDLDLDNLLFITLCVK